MKYRFALKRIRMLLMALLIFQSWVHAGDAYSPYVDQHYPTNVYWGDTHLHSNLSFDATLSGNTNLSQADAYKLASGGTVLAHNGMEVRLHRPLDFLVVADHAVNLGLLSGINNSDTLLLSTKKGRRLYNWYKTDQKAAAKYVAENILFTSLADSGLYEKSIWRRIASVADEYYNPGKFTTFSGFEWSSLGFGSPSYAQMGNLHRVVIFKDDAEKVLQLPPFSRIDSENPEDLWRYFERYQQITGGEVIAIPHNGNTSKGEMFSLTDYDGRVINKAYARTRSRWEPLYEVTQTKGDSETHPALSPTDQFSDYETWNSWHGRSMKGIKIKGWIDRKRSEYARSALKLGLDQQVKLGINPFKFGLIGSTDAHTSLSTADENNFFGKMTKYEPSAKRMLMTFFTQLQWEIGASGYAAVWAQENTRESLFAAMKRKEVYATTGPRMTVRFFGGWDYDQNDSLRPDLAHLGYTKGVPMGGDLTSAPNSQSPNFLIRAVKDPDGANLDRVQVIKGWRTESGELKEKVYDVALSDNRRVGRNGKVKPVGSTVDIKDASYTNSIGDPELAVVWTDPDFNADELAFYYVRVLEIPTPRWTAYDAKFFGLKDLPEEIPMVTQERAYTSPIWYSPNTPLQINK